MKAESLSPGVHRALVLLLAAAAAAPAVICWTGCGPEAPRSSKASTDGARARPAAPPIADPYLGPLETVRRVHQYRLAGQVASIGRHLVPEQRDAVIEHLLSLDELTSAGESLKARVDRIVGSGSAERFDRTGVANSVGPFSRDIECVSETIEGAAAVVRIRVAGRLPLEDVRLVRGDDCWLIRTDPPVVGVAVELRKLARVLRRVADDLERRKLSPEQIEAELALRQRPILERIGFLVRAAEAPAPP